MKYLITTIATVVLVGCGESEKSVPAPETKPVEPVAIAPKVEPSIAKAPDISINLAAGLLGNIEAVKQHLAAGADVNAKDDDTGMNPLHDAAMYGRKEIFELLISEGADVNAKDDAIWTPLHYAGGSKEVAELLIANGAAVISIYRSVMSLSSSLSISCGRTPAKIPIAKYLANSGSRL